MNKKPYLACFALLFCNLSLSAAPTTSNLSTAAQTFNASHESHDHHHNCHVCPPGLPGPAGAQGATGPSGTNGLDGSPGPAGPSGPQDLGPYLYSYASGTTGTVPTKQIPIGTDGIQASGITGTTVSAALTTGGTGIYLLQFTTSLTPLNTSDPESFRFQIDGSATGPTATVLSNIATESTVITNVALNFATLLVPGEVISVMNTSSATVVTTTDSTLTITKLGDELPPG